MKITLTKKLNQYPFHIDTQINDQGICVIFGRSGSGKTSFINMLAGIDTPDSGRIKIAGKTFFDSQAKINMATNKRSIGYVFQQPRLFPHLSVEQNLCYGYSKKTDRDASFYQKIIALLGLKDLLKNSPNELSGGEMQRVAIGRAILSRPKLLLMDEPLAALDLPKKRELLPYLRSLNKALALPILYVTHSLDEVLFLADEMILLEEGKCVLQGDLESVWNHPKMLPWLSSTRECSIVNAKLVEQHAQYPLTAVSMSSESISEPQYLWINRIEQPKGTQVRLRIYAKDVSISTIANDRTQTSIRNILAASVEEIAIQEHRVRIKLQLQDSVLWSEITLWALHDLALSVGQKVFAQIKGVSVSENDWAKH